MAVVDLATESAEAKTEIHVFEIVLIVGVEAADSFEVGPSHEQARSRDDLKTPGLVDGGVVGCTAGIDVERVAGEIEDDPCVLDRPSGNSSLLPTAAASGWASA